MLSDMTFNLENPVTSAGAGRCRAVASCALDLGLSTPALEACNSPFGLRQHASPLRGRSGAAAQVPSRCAMHPPVTTPPPHKSNYRQEKRSIFKMFISRDAGRADADTYRQTSQAPIRYAGRRH